LRWTGFTRTNNLVASLQAHIHKEVGMFLPMALSLSLLGQDKLPGSDRSLDQAMEKARIIVVAELESYTLVHGAGASAVMAGAKFKSAEVLKGRLEDGEMTNLAIMAIGSERLPRKGEECIYFLDDFANRLKAVKMLPKTKQNLEAVKESVKTKRKS
jgi:hypothetical protein